ncbi:MAG: DUF5615 family PIN-like protein [Methanoregula sp.]|nr:DUF5615 family PIN-like protein [Methanoregula sp.]
MSPEQTGRTRFVADRMLGTLCRYLRFMGYDIISANSLSPGNSSEDTLLIRIAHDEGRVLLTRDRDLASRAGPAGILITSDDVIGQVTQLRDAARIDPEIRMTRCSLCNTPLREASPVEIAHADYAPKDNTGFAFFFCPHCDKLYWNGSHGKNLTDRISRHLG